MRMLNNLELICLRFIASYLPLDMREYLLKDIKHCKVEAFNDNATILTCHIEDYPSINQKGQREYPFSAIMEDEDGSKISFIAYHDKNDHLMEIEFIKWGDQPIINPKLNTLLAEPSIDHTPLESSKIGKIDQPSELD